METSSVAPRLRLARMSSVCSCSARWPVDAAVSEEKHARWHPRRAGGLLVRVSPPTLEELRADHEVDEGAQFFAAPTGPAAGKTVFFRFGERERERGRWGRGVRGTGAG